MTDEIRRVKNLAGLYDPRFGPDIRGRLFAEDIDEYLVSSLHRTVSPPVGLTQEEFEKRLMQRSRDLDITRRSHILTWL